MKLLDQDLRVKNGEEYARKRDNKNNLDHIIVDKMMMTKANNIRNYLDNVFADEMMTKDETLLSFSQWSSHLGGSLVETVAGYCVAIRCRRLF